MGNVDRSNKIADVVARCVVAHFDGDCNVKVTESTRLIEDLGCDYLDIVEFCMLIERVFTVAVPSEEESKFRTVGDVMAFLLRKDAERTLSIDEDELHHF